MALDIKVKRQPPSMPRELLPRVMSAIDPVPLQIAKILL